MMRRKLCKHCKGKLADGEYIHPACVDGFAEAEAAKAERRQAKRVKDAVKAEKAQDRAKAEGMKRSPQLKKEAQIEFNKFIRERDFYLPCISCGAPPPDLSGLHAGRDAGHMRSVGSAPHLRYTEDNVAGQCVKCNRWGAGMALDFRRGQIERIGLERVEAVEQDNRIHKWTHEELRTIRDKYRKKAAELKKARLARC